MDDSLIVRDSGIVPEEVEAATVEAAIRSLSQTLLADLENSGTIKRTKDKVDVLETEVEYLGGSSPIPEFTLIDRILEPVTIPSNQLLRS